MIKHNKKHRFKEDKRMFPIDFAFPSTDLITIKIYYPDSYKLEQLSDNSSTNLLDNSAEYKFNNSQVDDYVEIKSNLFIRETFYTVEEYEYL